MQVYFSQTPRYWCQNYYKSTHRARVCKRISSFLHSGQAILSPFLNTFRAESHPSLQAGSIYDDCAYINIKLISIKLTSRLIFNLCFADKNVKTVLVVRIKNWPKEKSERPADVFRKYHIHTINEIYSFHSPGI